MRFQFLRARPSTSSFLKCLLVGALFALAKDAAAQAHGHLYIGATATTNGAPLTFDNGPDFTTASGYVKTLVFTNGGRFSNYFHGNITLTGLSRTPGHPEFSENAAALGAYLHAGIVAVEGPAGGEFGFWENGSTAPTISFRSGDTSTNLFRVSEGDGSAGSDPYGHIHGRRFTATKAGLYRITFKAWDLSANRPNGGPIHTASNVLPVYFQAGTVITSINRTGTTARVTFGSEVNRSYVLEFTDNIASNSWEQIGAAVIGNDYFQQLIDPAADDATRFYRVRGEAVTP